jgi:hypothetical protein
MSIWKRLLTMAGNEQGFVSVAEIELPQFKPQMQPD